MTCTKKRMQKHYNINFHIQFTNTPTFLNLLRSPSWVPYIKNAYTCKTLINIRLQLSVLKNYGYHKILRRCADLLICEEFNTNLTFVNLFVLSINKSPKLFSITRVNYCFLIWIFFLIYRRGSAICGLEN